MESKQLPVLRQPTAIELEQHDEFDTFQYWRLPIPDLPTDFFLQSSNEEPALPPVLTSLETPSINITCDPLVSDDMEIDIGIDQVFVDEPKEDSSVLTPVEKPSEVEEEERLYPIEVATKSEEAETEVSDTKTLLFGSKSPIFEANVPFFKLADNSTSNLPTLSNEFIVQPPYSGNCGTIHTTNISFGFSSTVRYSKVPSNQDIIPCELLEHYLNMTSPINYQVIDQDLTHHCAYSFPGVALTLGRKYWPCLKETYELLALDMQWKVRWTLASSLHQMALILGPDYTTRDLLPVFLSFMKDLDEVRFGILQNLAAILRLLNRPEQLGILPKISEFLKMDNNRNWRFRSTLSEQIIEIASIYEPAQIKEYLLPIAFTLLKDKVAEVRLGAIRLLSTLARHFFCDTSGTDPALLNQMTQELVAEVNDFVGSSKWSSRQVFVLLCEQLLLDCALPSQVFIEHFFAPLLALSTDPVPNVRLALSRCLSKTFGTSGKFTPLAAICPSITVLCATLCFAFLLEALQSEKKQVLDTLHILRNDTDTDVHRFADSMLIGCEPPRLSVASDMDIELMDDDSKMNCEDTSCN